VSQAERERKTGKPFVRVVSQHLALTVGVASLQRCCRALLITVSRRFRWSATGGLAARTRSAPRSVEAGRHLTRTVADARLPVRPLDQGPRLRVGGE
jgi:hypothetical protein